MFLFNALMKVYVRLRLRWLRQAGLALPADCRLGGIPDFGSEPYLVHIGRHVAMGSGVSFITHDGGTHVFRHIDRYRKVIKYGHITIHDNCVIGQRAIILPGVSIGPNSVVAAGSVVSRSIPPDVLAAGNPARPVMSIHQYAEWCLAATSDYDVEEYHRDKRAFLLKCSLRGAPPDTMAAAQAPPGEADRP
jgi:acetyltransferase-like isoleucine patch superfamily enzyme